ncbi:hypothetical protein [Allokutzneria albata]|uniref:Uncharacterized protein n=1 Tax=Allokutzneria albata TaxID=211114 RepID=A0A1G9TIL2_ALLAB|nr:hypothetical protein [Allokutzneria albata]SDM47388.1 hypothetical protein SAMN04489726_1804 [Allokutzneria albata]
MTARLLMLHVRARQAALPLVVLAVAAFVDWRMLTVVAAALIGPALGGADPVLERSTAVPWRWWRLTHVLVATLLIMPVGADGIGLVGMALLGAVLLGPKLAWLPVIVYTVPALALGLPLWPSAAAAWAVWLTGAVLYPVVGESSRPFSIT